MRRHKIYLRITLLISILLGIILPLALGVKDPTLIAISFCFIWFIYAVMILITVFLVEGRHARNKSNIRNEEDPSFLHPIQEWEALWEITIKRYKDPRMGNHGWN